MKLYGIKRHVSRTANLLYNLFAYCSKVIYLNISIPIGYIGHYDERQNVEIGIEIDFVITSKNIYQLNKCSKHVKILRDYIKPESALFCRKLTCIQLIKAGQQNKYFERQNYKMKYNYSRYSIQNT